MEWVVSTAEFSKRNELFAKSMGLRPCPCEHCKIANKVVVDVHGLQRCSNDSCPRIIGREGRNCSYGGE